jgi:ADP-ribosylglycohydrolase
VTPDEADKIRGCLFGGAVGDALGAPVEFERVDAILEGFGPAGVTDLSEAFGRVGAVTDDTQMTLFTAEGLVRMHLRAASRGVGPTVSVIAHAYARWLHTQGEEPPALPGNAIDGWLVKVPELQHRRAPGTTCLEALRTGREGGIEEPLNDSKGCGGVMRVAPIGLYPAVAREAVFDLACEAAALTHGHPTGYLAAGAFAEIIACIARDGLALDPALDRAERRLFDWAPGGAAQTIQAIEAARYLARPGNGIAASATAVESLGGGWVAEDALAIGVYCALVARDFSSGVLLAVNHSGDSDSTASICGNLLGARGGLASIPPGWINQLDVTAAIQRICHDWEYISNNEELVVDEDWVADEWNVAYPPV